MGSCLSDKTKAFDNSQVEHHFPTPSQRYLQSHRRDSSQRSEGGEPRSLQDPVKKNGHTAQSYVYSNRFRTPSKIPGPSDRPGQSVASFDTPTTADMSWGSGSESEPGGGEHAPKNAGAVPTPEKMSKMDRIRAKAIKAANKDYGIDEGKLADALGLQAPDDTQVPQNGSVSKLSAAGGTSPTTGPFADVQDDQMRYLADTLGLPASFFGVTANPPPPRSPGGESIASSHSRNLFQAAMANVPLAEEASGSESVEEEADDNHRDGVTVVVPPQPHSLASALGMAIDPSSKAPAVRNGEFQRQPQTTEEKRAHKEKAVNRLNRIKAKAIKSANKSLGIDENHLSQAIGMSLEEYEVSANKRREKKMKEANQDPEQIQYLADAVGLPLEMFGMKKAAGNDPPKESAPAQPGSLAQALGMAVDTSSEAPAVREVKSPLRSPSARTDPGSSQPQVGSLADALGMSVHSPTEEAPVRLVESAHTSTNSPVTARAGSLAAALGLQFEEQPVATAKSPTPQKHPQAGSLAAALGMQVSNKVDSTPTRAATSAAREGSLGAALGMHVSSATVRHDAQASSHKKSNTAEPGSLAAALGMGIADSNDGIETVDAAPSGSPNPRSLAAALGMAVDPNSTASPIRQVLERDSKKNASVGETHGALPGSLAAALGVPVGEASASKEPLEPKTRAIPGSLAAALGAPVAPERRSPPGPGAAQPGSLAAALGMHVGNVSSVAQSPMVATRAPTKDRAASHESVGSPRVGSLAEALGMRVGMGDTDSTRAQTKDRAASHESAGPPQAGSLAEALGMRVGINVDTDSTRAQTRDRAASHESVETPRTGSLAEALGMRVDTAYHASPVRQDNTASVQPATAAPQSGGLAAALGALGFSVDTDYDAGPVRQDTQPAAQTARAAPQAGSLAAALGMAVDSSHKNVPAESDGSDEEDSEGSYSSDEDSVTDDFTRHGASQPQAGSLAAALGMTVDSSTSAVPVRQIESSQIAEPKAKKSLFGEVFSTVVAKQAPKSHSPNTGAAPKLNTPNTGSLADALGMAVEPSQGAPGTERTPERKTQVQITTPPPSSRTDRSLPQVYPASPGLTAEAENIHLRSEIAAAKAETAGAQAYAKALEDQMLQMSRTYAEKVASFQLQISSYEQQLNEKTEEISRLNSEQDDQQKAQEVLFEKICETGERLGRGRSLLDEADSIFQSEFNSIMELKRSIEAQAYAESEDGSVVEDEMEIQRTASVSSATRDIHHTLQREDSRRESLKARLQAIRDNRKKNNVD